jgi:hypothetical protein
MRASLAATFFVFVTRVELNFKLFALLYLALSLKLPIRSRKV